MNRLSSKFYKIIKWPTSSNGCYRDVKQGIPVTDESTMFKTLNTSILQMSRCGLWLDADTPLSRSVRVRTFQAIVMRYGHDILL